MSEYHEEAQDKDFERVAELLRASDCVPEAPDCRAAVFARIAKPKPLIRHTWAYGSALAVIVAAIGLVPFLLTDDSGQKDSVAPPQKHVQPAPVVTAEQPRMDSLAGAPEAQPPAKKHYVRRRATEEAPVRMAMAVPETSPEPYRRLSADKPVAPDPAPDNRTMWALDKAEPESVEIDSKSDYVLGARVHSGETAGSPDVAPSSEESPVPAKAKAGSDFSLRDARRRSEPGRPAPAIASAPAAKILSRTRASNEPASAAATWADTTITTHRDLADSYYRFTAPASGLPLAEMPLAVAMVTWPSNTQPSDSYNYAYTDRDPATGNTTECRVKRSGKSVEIHIESRPAPVLPRP